MIDRNVHIQNYNRAKIRYMHIYPKVNLGRIYVLHSLSIKQPQIKPSTNTRTSKCIAVHKCEKETKLLCLKSWKGANRTLCPRMTQTANDEVSVFPTVTKLFLN